MVGGCADFPWGRWWAVYTVYGQSGWRWGVSCCRKTRKGMKRLCAVPSPTLPLKHWLINTVPCVLSPTCRARFHLRRTHICHGGHEILMPPRSSSLGDSSTHLRERAGGAPAEYVPCPSHTLPDKDMPRLMASECLPKAPWGPHLPGK